MGFNLGNIRSTKKTNETVNGHSYLEVARSYYNSAMYEDENFVVDDLFVETKPVFNAVPKVVNIATALSTGGEILPVYDDIEYVENIIKQLGLRQEKTFITRDLLLGKSVLLEIQNIENMEDRPDDGFDSPDFPYKLAYYSADEYQLVSEGEEILWAEIEGVTLELNDNKDGYVEKKIKKVYMRDDTGNAVSYVLDENDKKTDETQYDAGVLPLVEIVTTYDMKQLFFSVDRHNELESFIRNILYLAGEPILAITGTDRLSNKREHEVDIDKYKKQKSLFTKNPEASIQMIELTGTSAQVMMQKQSQIVDAIIKDYPEYSISDVLSGGNVSEETTRIRLTEVLSRVQEVRANMLEGLNTLIGIIGFYDGKDMVKKYIEFESMLASNLNEVLNIVKTAHDAGLLSRESAMNGIKELFMSGDVEEEIKLVDAEKEENMKNAQDNMGGDINGQASTDGTISQ